MTSLTLFPVQIRALRATVLSMCLAACVPPDGLGEPDRALAVPDFAQARVPAPPGVRPDSCWVRDVSPAQVETVTRQIEVSPARRDAEGRLLSPARYRTETAQVIVAERQELVFETPCPDRLTPDFVATLQRALEARGLYRGPISGKMDIATRRAVRRYQRQRGLPSALLSMQSARALGLIATPREAL